MVEAERTRQERHAGAFPVVNSCRKQPSVPKCGSIDWSRASEAYAGLAVAQLCNYEIAEKDRSSFQKRCGHIDHVTFIDHISSFPTILTEVHKLSMYKRPTGLVPAW